eukprot:UN09590
MLENNFSTTTNLEKIASKVSLMAACKHYFTYIVYCGCGFRQITLDGNKTDWINLKKKVELIFADKVDKQWAHKWGTPLFEILDRFIEAYDGEIDCLFWNSMVRRGRVVSGMMVAETDFSNEDSYYSGWVNVFFPYMNQMKETHGGWDDMCTHNDPDGNNSSFQENRASLQSYSLDQYVPSGYGWGNAEKH